ncbi:MAG: glycoside hydrolase family 3 N-terminal domain-containing protein [Propionibacteriaceae bacterium]|nr:glycoside hydrolase family 3 N-terminal domain-containing protein [Propionibacteriaceae bacterium]
MSHISRRAALGLGAGAVAAAAVAAPARAETYLEPYEELANSLTLDQKIRQLFAQPIYGGGIDQADPRNTERYGVATPAEVIRRHGFGGIIFRPDPGQFATLEAVLAYVKDLQRVAHDDVGVGVQVIWEGHLNGLVDAGIAITEFPEPMALGAYERLSFPNWGFNDTQTSQIATLGINSWYGIRADIASNPNNPVQGTQAFGGNVEIVAGRARNESMAAYGSPITASFRMFPGAGDVTLGESGLPVLSRTREEWDALEGAVYKRAVGGSNVVQLGHIIAPGLDPKNIPASLSWTIVNEILRRGLGFSGVVATESLSDPAMRALWSDEDLAMWALIAGVNQLYDAADPEAAIRGIRAGMEKGYIGEEDIHRSVLRVLEQKRSVRRDPSRGGADVINDATDQYIAKRTARGGVTVVHNDGLLPLKQPMVVIGHHERLGEALVAELPEGSSFTSVGIDPTEQEIAAAQEAASGAAAVVVLTDDVAAHPAQKQLVDALNQAGARVVAVAVGLPHDVGRLDAAAKVATYTSRPVVAWGLAAVLTGRWSPSGKLPMAVPTPEGELPIGTGLTW